MINNPRAYEENGWLDYAVCRLPGAAPMFPHENDETGILNAKGECFICPVAEECLRAALARGEQWGVWGGLTAEERKSLRRRQQRGARAVTDHPLPPAA